MAKLFSEAALRASWEAERMNIQLDLLDKKFNPNAVHRAADNFIESMVFARIPCTSEAGLKAAVKQYAAEQFLPPAPAQ